MSTGALDLGEVERIKIQMREHRSGSGSPEGVLDGSLYETYSDEDTSPETAYVKLIDGGNTGWTAAGGGTDGVPWVSLESALVDEQTLLDEQAYSFYSGGGGIALPQSTETITINTKNNQKWIDIEGLPNLTAINCPLLETIPAVSEGYFEVGPGCPLVSSVNAPLFRSTDGNIWLDGLAITSFPLLALESCKNLFCINCSVLAEVDLTALANLTGTPPNIDFHNCALSVSSVNAILAKAVSLGMTTGTVKLDGGTAAAPAGQGIIDAAALSLAGVTVETN
jgi:hypothetical protein